MAIAPDVLERLRARGDADTAALLAEVERADLAAAERVAFGYAGVPDRLGEALRVVLADWYRLRGEPMPVIPEIPTAAAEVRLEGASRRTNRRLTP